MAVCAKPAPASHVATTTKVGLRRNTTTTSRPGAVLVDRKLRACNIYKLEICDSTASIEDILDSWPEDDVSNLEQYCYVEFLPSPAWSNTGKRVGRIATTKDTQNVVTEWLQAPNQRSTLQIGAIVTARAHDGSYYAAQVQQIKSETATVLFLAYGKGQGREKKWDTHVSDLELVTPGTPLVLDSNRSPYFVKRVKKYGAPSDKKPKAIKPGASARSSKRRSEKWLEIDYDWTDDEKENRPDEPHTIKDIKEIAQKEGRSFVATAFPMLRNIYLDTPRWFIKMLPASRINFLYELYAMCTREMKRASDEKILNEEEPAALDWLHNKAVRTHNALLDVRTTSDWTHHIKTDPKFRKLFANQPPALTEVGWVNEDHGICRRCPAELLQPVQPVKPPHGFRTPLVCDDCTFDGRLEIAQSNGKTVIEPENAQGVRCNELG